MQQTFLYYLHFSFNISKLLYTFVSVNCLSSEIKSTLELLLGTLIKILYKVITNLNFTVHVHIFVFLSITNNLFLTDLRKI